MRTHPRPALGALVIAGAGLTACGDVGARAPSSSPSGSPPSVPACVPQAAAATGDLSVDILGRWQRIRHYTDQRFYDFADDGTVTVWYVDLGEEPRSERTTWNSVGEVVDIAEEPATRLEMSLAPSPIGDVWRAPAEYIFRRCTN